ncbi:sensor histidine kinase [Streptomyces aureocirculatus]|uniref:sensor histidine kinase n=1 Tax=Streptomyces aureocirculatus TaxID=67275 RepID=UPI00099B989C|nr:sensor histidine kinase [Streptomyces aureocirculatus]
MTPPGTRDAPRATPQNGHPATPRARATAFLRAPLSRRAWTETAYCLLALPLGLTGGVLLTVLLALGAGLTVSLVGAVIGVFVLLGCLGLARGLGALHRGLASGLLGERLPRPVPPRPGSGVVGRLDARLRDGAGWRAVAYVLVKLPVSALGLYAVLWWVTGLVNLTAPLRWGAFGQGTSGDVGGMPVLTPVPVGGLEVRGFAGTFAALALGLALLLLAPWPTRLVVEADRWLLRALLGPGRLAERVRDLETTRALAVDDSVALLRSVERDLHDGAQVRLVAVAMTLDMIREHLGDPPPEPAAPPPHPPLDLVRLRHLVDTAHHNATEALTELRDLARGIHPPALDEGLPDALATLAARGALPVELSTDIPRRPTPAIETIAYFCAAELLTNVIKHSGAARAAITVAEGADGVLRLRVSDDGRGGARMGAGSGLPGLAQRVRTVDGRLLVDSPRGGPTTVVVELPLHA